MKERSGMDGAKDFFIDDEFDGVRLDRFVRSLFPGMGFQAAQSLIRKKKVLLNGKKAAGARRLSLGDNVRVMAEGPARDSDAGRAQPPASGGRPEGPGKDTGRRKGRRPEKSGEGGPGRSETLDRLIRIFGRVGEGIDILFEDEDLLVIDKPAGIVVQPGNDRSRGSLLDLLEDYRLRALAGRPRSEKRREMTRQREKARSMGRTGSPPPFRYTPVHRLDRGTSGALAVAKTRKAARTLSTFFRSGRVEKAYLAVVEGCPELKSGVIDSPIKTTRGVRSASSTTGKGKPSVTRYRLKKRLPGGRSLLEVVIDTGRTHQIRVHLASIGLPIAGDGQYGRINKETRKVARRNTSRSSTRLMLHSSRLAFEHPSGKGLVQIDSPAPDVFML